jgi:hypothetical protein
MGLALDEPRAGDETHQFNGLRVVVDSFAAKIIRDSGGLTIRDTPFGPVAELKGASACGC